MDKSEVLIFTAVFVLACGIWLVFSSSSHLSFTSKIKAVATTACFIPILYLVYSKFYPAQMQNNNKNNPFVPSAQALDICQSSWARHAVTHTSPTSCCMIFEYIMKLHGKREWGSLLDAGTGSHSLGWVVGLNTTKWTAITGSQQRSDNMISEFKDKIREGKDEVVFGNWLDQNLLKGQVFDVVLADYLLGSIDGFAPYFQDKLFDRLKPHVKKDLYFVGMEPLPDKSDTVQGQLVIEIAKLRDACILLAGHRCYREYPLDWTLRHLTKAGFKIQNVSNFETVQTADFVEVQLNVAESKIEFIKDLQVAEAMKSHIKRMRKRIYDTKWGVRFGGDYVIHATKITEEEK